MAPPTEDDKLRHLAEEQERLRITLASIGDAVISTDAQGRVAFLNRVAEQLTGWGREEALGRPLPEILQLYSEDGGERLEDPAQRALSQGGTVELPPRTVLAARDGQRRPIEDSAALMRDGDGRPIGVVLVFRDVTERNRADEAQARLAAIVQSSDDAILSKTLDGIIRSWNAGAQRLFGYTEEEAVGQHITLLVPPDRLDEEADILRRLRRGEKIDHFETIRRHKDGTLLDISLTVSPVKDAAGRVIGASKIARDITPRKRSEEALRSSEARHRFLSDLAAATLTLSDPQEISAVGARLLGEHLAVDRCAYAQVEDESVFVVTGDHDRGVSSMVGRWPLDTFGAECARRMRANQPYVVEDAEADPHAAQALPAYRQAQIRALLCMPLHTGGRLTAAMAVHQKTPRRWTPEDVELLRTALARTWESLERARVARGLQETAERLGLAMEAARLGDWAWDAGTDLVTLSPRAAEIFGIPAGTYMTWTRMQQLLHPEDREHARLAVERAVENRAQYDVEYRVERPDGSRVWVSAKGHAQYSSSGTPQGMFGVLQDITERRRLEDELRRRAAELAEADRQKDDFIALLAHELRNPLAPVLTGLELLRLAAGDAQKQARAREMMSRQLTHMVRLIDDLLDASRISRSKLHLQKKPVHLKEVLEHALEVAGPSIEAAGLQLHVSVPPEEVPLDADLTRLAQVFGNLLTNSAKYTERGGEIWLTASVRGQEAVVAVRDTGIGISAEDLPHVFDMFSQAGRAMDRRKGGLGIGLALVKGLVEAHGGKVTAQSPGPQAGSTFTVQLPLRTQPAAAAAPPSAPPAEEALRAVRRVLVADDNVDGASSLAELLELLGTEVHVAHDGREAVALAERVHPELVFMDIGMPVMDGLAATREIRQHPWGREVTIIALTGWGQKSDRDRTREAGCDGHLVKPVTLPQMEQLLEQLRRH